jgi:hypothetical protein
VADAVRVVAAVAVVRLVAMPVPVVAVAVPLAPTSPTPALSPAWAHKFSTLRRLNARLAQLVLPARTLSGRTHERQQAF